MSDDILDAAEAAALALAAERPWRDVSLRQIAEQAGVDFADLYAKAPGKSMLVLRLSQKLDRAALATAATASDDLHDRLFDATMARVEAMEPSREALRSMAKGENAVALASLFPLTARAILEAAGVSATPARLAAMTFVWGRIVQVWRDDEGALNRTMAEIDKRLKQMRQRLGRIGAGF
ncbi:MAG TPA: TetR family transcriptional regulator [Caulobacteraceae bacterium]|jgi:AcrR family transcriptional regulator|nr:TetR family transcriptional regulator [Caulobacteraceae bacterium]